jgi:hypothetical protein
MARFEERKLTCPHCQHQTTQRVAMSLDADHGAAQVQQIMDGTFQRFTCTSCSKVYRADGPLMYLDFDEKRWVGVFPEPDEARWWKMEREPVRAFELNILENAPPMVREWAPGFEIRAVFGLENLREKLVAWGAKLDDRVLEAYKLSLLRSMGPYPLGPAARPRLRGVRDDGTLEFEVRFPEGQPMRLAKVAIERRELERVASNREEWAEVIEAVSSGPYVDLGRLFIPRIDDAPAAAPGEGAEGKPADSSGASGQNLSQ